MSSVTPKHKQGMCAAAGSRECKSTVYSCYSKSFLWKARPSGARQAIKDILQQTKNTEITLKVYYFSELRVG